MSFFPVIAYPLEVVKTNRIVGMQNAALQSTEELSRDLLKLAERGSLRTGMFRGLATVIPCALLENQRLRGYEEFRGAHQFLGFSTYTLLMQPFAVLQTKKQVLATGDASYAQLVKQLGPRLFTLGLGSTCLRNFSLMFSFFPRYYGIHDEASQLLAAVGAVALSHPFEVARVLIVNNGSGFAHATLRDLVATKGIAGLFAGFIPRTIFMAPSLLALNFVMNRE